MSKGVKARMSTCISSFFLWTSSGNGSTHDDGLHLPPWFCDDGVSWHAHRVAWAPSPHPLLAGLHASHAPGAKNLGRDGQVDACRHHRVALWASAQSDLLACASAHQLVGAGSRGDLASASQWHPAPV